MKVGCCVVVKNYEDKILGIECSKGRGYVLPGGKHEEGESYLECAKRELFEETGVDVDKDYLQLIFHGVNVDGYYCYVFQTLVYNPKLVPSSEGKPVWLKPEDFTNSMFSPFYELFF